MRVGWTSDHQLLQLHPLPHDQCAFEYVQSAAIVNVALFCPCLATRCCAVARSFIASMLSFRAAAAAAAAPAAAAALLLLPPPLLLPPLLLPLPLLLLLLALAPKLVPLRPPTLLLLSLPPLLLLLSLAPKLVPLLPPTMLLLSLMLLLMLLLLATARLSRAAVTNTYRKLLLPSSSPLPPAHTSAAYPQPPP